MDNLSIFKTECEYWIKYFGLLDWDILYISDKIEARATYILHLTGRTATLTINNEEMSRKQICQSAFHEIIHLLISELAHYTDRVTDNSEEIQHVLIRRMENSVFEIDYTWRNHE